MTLYFVINGTYFLVAMQFTNVERLQTKECFYCFLFLPFASTYQKDFCIESITCYSSKKQKDFSHL